MTAILPTTKESPTEGFVRLPLAFLRPQSAPAFDLYGRTDKTSKPSLLASHALGLDAESIASLAQNGSRELYVRKCDLLQHSAAIKSSLGEILNDASLPEAERFAILQSSMAIEIEHALRNPNPTAYISLSNRIGDQLAQLISLQTTAPDQLFALAHHDTTTFVHVTNVAAYALVLADALGIDNEATRREIAVGAMLHDIGKREIPLKILTKPAALTAAERAVIETHPLSGYVLLCNRPDVTFGQMMMTYQHHEWINGNGYPVGIVAAEIHPLAKLLAVVDVFDALTARRPYRTPTPIGDVLAMLANGAGKQFDPEIVRCWIKLFPQ